MSAAGWVRLHRQLAEHPLWRSGRFTRGQAWVDLILMASFGDYVAFQGNRPLTVKRGQVLTSQVKLAARWKWNRKTVVSFFLSLKAANMVDIVTSKETDTGYTLITLRNYGRFQDMANAGADIENGAPLDIGADIERTSNGHRVPTDKKVKKVNTLADADASAPVSKGNGKVRKTPPETDALLHDFAAAFQSKLSEPYLIEWARDRKVMGGLVALYGAESVREKLKAFFAHGTRETRERRAWTVPEFRRVFPQLVAMKAMGDL